jgi:hypothetical protein
MENQDVKDGVGEKELTYEEKAVDALTSGKFEDAFLFFKKHESEYPATEPKGMAWGEEIKNVKMPRSEIVARQQWLPEEIMIAEESEKTGDYKNSAEHYAIAERIYRDVLNDRENANKMREKANNLPEERGDDEEEEEEEFQYKKAA